MTACDVIIKAAAVADYTSETVASQEIGNSGERMQLELKRTRDILAEAGQRKEGRFLVGFAAETEQVAQHAMDKLHRKNLDLVVANDVSLPGAGFDGDTNRVTVFDADGEVVSLPQMSKREVADRLVALIGERLHHG